MLPIHQQCREQRDKKTNTTEMDNNCHLKSVSVLMYTSTNTAQRIRVTAEVDPKEIQSCFPHTQNSPQQRTEGERVKVSHSVVYVVCEK